MKVLVRCEIVRFLPAAAGVVGIVVVADVVAVDVVVVGSTPACSNPLMGGHCNCSSVAPAEEECGGCMPGPDKEKMKLVRTNLTLFYCGCVVLSGLALSLQAGGWRGRGVLIVLRVTLHGDINCITSSVL